MLAQEQKNAPESVPKDPAYAPLSKAFDALRGRDYDTAISWFDKAGALAPGRADIRKNLGYALLKIGDSEGAREAFGEALRLDPADAHLALEYAFLCYEAREDGPARKAEARRIFARIRDSGDAALRATAAEAFQNIDGPLAAGIARWQEVLATGPPTFSAYYELAQLAERRDEFELAVGSYKSALRLQPERRSVLLELARVERARGNPEGFTAAVLAASRGPETRTAELAREQLPDRYPWVYEFRNALELDPTNSALHRELAYLLLAMAGKEDARLADAVTEFQRIVERSPNDYLAAAQLGMLRRSTNENTFAIPLAPGAPTLTADAPLDARVLGERSYQAGFIKDARRYFLVAREENPVDGSIALKLGWTSNLLHDDPTALHWFDIARRSADPTISTEARRAWGNLKPGVERFRTTLWLYPLFSSRWSDLFGYGQVKTEVRVGKLPFRPYASLRFVGDVRRSLGGIPPQSLSESSFIFGAGVVTRSWRGVLGWFEAGTSVSYLHGAHLGDYRGGVSYSRTIGASLAAEHNGWFVETLADSVFISRFSDDLLNYSQTRFGYTTAAGGFKVQPFWAGNITFDAKRQYWANFLETGPGVRFRPPGVPPSVAITVGGVRGVYLRNVDNPRRPNFYDFRAGVWYAITK